MATMKEAASALGALAECFDSNDDAAGMGFIRKAIGGQNPVASQEAVRVLSSPRSKAPDFVGTPLERFNGQSAKTRKALALVVILGRQASMKRDGTVKQAGPTVRSETANPAWVALRDSLIAGYGLEHERTLYPVHERDKRRLLADDDPPDTSDKSDSQEQAI